MQRKLTITVDEKVYESLHAKIGRGNISHFMEMLVRPYLFNAELESAYAQMAADGVRESEAEKWGEALIADVDHAPR